MGTARRSSKAFDLVVLSNRLPVDAVHGPNGDLEWCLSPGGLVTALEPVMRKKEAVWVGWSGAAGEAPPLFKHDGMSLVGVPLSDAEIVGHYEGFSNGTLWPLYHDVIAPPEFHREWWDSFTRVNQRFADMAAELAAPEATVWVHDYQLQLVPRMLRELRPDLRIGFFNHIPFPGYEIFAQLPWRRQIIEGLLGADLVGFQRRSDATNFLRACRRAAVLPTRGSTVRSGDGRMVRATAFPISIDGVGFEELARREDVQLRAKEIRAALGDPDVLLLGVDRLDYTKGILHRLKAYGELLADGHLLPPQATLVQVASPSRDRVTQYQVLREEVETMVGRINGAHGSVGTPPIHYLHQSHPREEMAALFVAADVMLVTALRDGMNLVAKEYVACRTHEDGALVLSEFTGAADELSSALLVNPHDIEGLKATILEATRLTPAESRRRMRSLRRQLKMHDVHHWAEAFLLALNSTVVQQERAHFATGLVPPASADAHSNRKSSNGRQVSPPGPCTDAIWPPSTKTYSMGSPTAP